MQVPPQTNETPIMVKLISLADQHETVRRFFESLVPDPDGAVVEVNGRRVYLIVRPDRQAGQPDEPWTDEKNHRRCDLIDRKYASGLTPAEEVELAGLQAAMHRFIDAVAPLPIEAARKLHQELMEKAARTGTGA